MNDFFIGIELTRHCNLRCAHCFRADLDKFSEIPYETVEKILVQAKRYQKPHIALTGGETTLHTKFVEILDLIASHGYTFHFVTNGFNYQRVFRSLYHLFGNPAWKGVSFSIDGATAETHDKIRGKGSFHRLLAGMAIARTHNLEVVAQMVAHRGNSHEIEALAVLCSKMDVTRLHIAHMQPTPHAVAHGLLHSPEEYRMIERDVGDLQGRFRMPIAFSAGYYDQTPLAHCKFLRLGALNIDHKGRLTACCQLSNMEGDNPESDLVNDLNETPLEEAHKNLLKTYQGIFDARLEKMQDGTFQDLDHFHCWSCQKHFKKVDWMREYPDNEWVKADAYFRAPEVK
jgi:MoaA/NifB/PqqE/SkfB family radical SAM enzyme